MTAPKGDPALTREELIKEIHDGNTWAVVATYDVLHAALAAKEEECERLRGERDVATINEETGEEISAELFDLCCAVVDGSPNAAAALGSLREHIEHVKSCRMGSCATELGETQKARADRVERERDEERNLKKLATERADTAIAAFNEVKAELADWRMVPDAIRQMRPGLGNSPLAVTSAFALERMGRDRLERERERLRAEVREARGIALAAHARADRLAAIVEKAPHAPGCGEELIRTPDGCTSAPCNCWKSTAKEKTDALHEP